MAQSTRPRLSELTLDEFLKAYPRMAGAEEPTPEAAKPEGEEKPAETVETPKPEDALGDAGKAALDAERKARKAAEKRASDLERERQEREDAGKTESQRAADQAAREKARADQAEAKVNRLEVALAKSVPADLAALLNGTREEMEAQADAILAHTATKPAPKDEEKPAEPGLLDGGVRIPPKDDPLKNVDRIVAAFGVA